MDISKELSAKIGSSKIEAMFKQNWEEMDPDNKGYITYDVFREYIMSKIKSKNWTELEPNPEATEKAKKLVDPDETGKITFENYVKLLIEPNIYLRYFLLSISK